MSNVSWGRRARYKFSAQGELTRWSPPMVPGVFAITYRQEPEARPKSHTVLFFGQADDMSKQLANIDEGVCDFWSNSGGKNTDLYVFVYPMPGSTQYERTQVQSQLISEYSPNANF